MRWAIALFVMAALFGSPAWGAEGDIVSSARSGPWQVDTYDLCVDKDANDTICTEFDLDSSGATTRHAGRPDWMLFMVTAAATCTADISVEHNNISGGTRGRLGLLDDLATSIGRSLRIQGPTAQYITVDLALLATCVADQVDMQLLLFYRQDQ